MFDMYELLDTLMAVRAPSGREYRLAEKITELLTPFVDKCWTDRVGNVIGFIEGEGEVEAVQFAGVGRREGLGLI